jgi:hypothetical protein
MCWYEIGKAVGHFEDANEGKKERQLLVQWKNIVLSYREKKIQRETT